MPNRVTITDETNQFIDACDIEIERTRNGLKIFFKSPVFAPMFRGDSTTNAATAWAENDTQPGQRRYNIPVETARACGSMGCSLDTWGMGLQANGAWNISMFRHAEFATGATIYIRNAVCTKELALQWASAVKRILPQLYAELNQRWTIKVKVRIETTEH